MKQIITKKFISFIFIALLGSFLFAQVSGNYEILDRQTVNGFDRLFMKPYSESLDKAGTFLTVGMLAAPALLVLVPACNGQLNMGTWDGWKSSLTLGGIYAGSVAAAILLKEGLKHIVSRNRPYMYFPGAPENEILSGECRDSFPSGHTTLAFCAASFLSVTFCILFPESKWKGLVIGTSFGCATLLGATRVMAGCHFATDVLAGAVIGTLCGGLMPLLFVNQKTVGFAYHGTGVNFTIRM